MIEKSNLGFLYKRLVCELLFTMSDPTHKPLEGPDDFKNACKQVDAWRKAMRSYGSQMHTEQHISQYSGLSQVTHTSLPSNSNSQLPLAMNLDEMMKLQELCLARQPSLPPSAKNKAVSEYSGLLPNYACLSKSELKMIVMASWWNERQHLFDVQKKESFSWRELVLRGAKLNIEIQLNRIKQLNTKLNAQSQLDRETLLELKNENQALTCIYDLAQEYFSEDFEAKNKIESCLINAFKNILKADEELNPYVWDVLTTKPAIFCLQNRKKMLLELSV